MSTKPMTEGTMIPEEVVGAAAAAVRMAIRDGKHTYEDIARAALSAAGVGKLVEELRDMAERGLRFDLNPTHDTNYCEEFWHSYIREADKSIRERARSALSSYTGTRTVAHPASVSSKGDSDHG